MRGEFQRAAELIAVALAEEAQRGNQRMLQGLDMMQHPDEFRSVHQAMAMQQQLAASLRVPLLDEREPPVFARCLAQCLAQRRQAFVASGGGGNGGDGESGSSSGGGGVGVAGDSMSTTPSVATKERGAGGPSAAAAALSEPLPPLPRPLTVLGAIAKRWYLPVETVEAYWRDFVSSSGGAFTLSLARARSTILRGQSTEVALATWRLAVTDTAAADLIVDIDHDEEQAAAAAEVAAAAEAAEAEEAERAAAEKAAEAAAMAAAFGPLGSVGTAIASAVSDVTDAVSAGMPDGVTLVGDVRGMAGVGGAGGLSFEEYVVLRGLVESECLEEQYRFLWRLLDRDSDGHLSRDDLRAALRLQAARLSWDEPTLRKWADWAADAIRGNGKAKALGAARANEQGAGPENVYAALQRSAQLRTVLMAAEPEAGGLLTRQGSYRQAPERGGAAGRVLALLTESIGSMTTAP